MILSKSFWQTYKEVPKEAEILSHQLMLRAGLIQKSGPGLYNYLPFGLKTIKKVEKIIREEMDKIGCMELLMTMVTPGELWQETGRWDAMGDLMVKFQDKNKRDLCLSPTNEEAVVDIFRKSVTSYKSLPLALYQINTKFRDEIRPRFGLMRGREFVMKDAYSFHESKNSLDQFYEKIYQAYENIFKRMGLDFIAVEADGGSITGGGKAKTHEFQVLANSGEDALIFCPSCRYAANVETAVSKRINNEIIYKPAKGNTIIDTPGTKTIKDVCDLLDIPASSTIKTLIYKVSFKTKERFAAIYLHGDDEVNEIKLKSALNADFLGPAQDQEISQLGLLKGFIGVTEDKGLINLFDSTLISDKQYLMGANQIDKHKWAQLDQFSSFNEKNQSDIRVACSGDQCSSCGNILQLKRGIEVGHIFQLGEKYTKSMNASVLDQNGKKIFPVMGCYGVGVTRTIAAAIEQHHDEKGIVWPKTISPFHVYIAVLAKDPSIRNLAEKLYFDLNANQIESLLDDRNVGPGFMFKDSDLLGLPLRVVFGERDFKEDGQLEIKVRKTDESIKCKLEDVIPTLTRILSNLS